MELKNIDIEVWTKDTFPRNCPVVTTYTIETVLIMTISTPGYGQTDRPTDRPTDIATYRAAIAAKNECIECYKNWFLTHPTLMYCCTHYILVHASSWKVKVYS